MFFRPLVVWSTLYSLGQQEKSYEYYEYVLLYVDDCLVISENGENILTQEIGR